jgi:hypothetical protein
LKTRFFVLESGSVDLMSPALYKLAIVIIADIVARRWPSRLN